MEKMLTLLWAWGIGDSIWMALDPPGWSRFWGRWIRFVGRSAEWSKVAAAAQLGLSVYMLRRGTR
jgi:hypothetical protein